jgi:hypothetical protein
MQQARFVSALAHYLYIYLEKFLHTTNVPLTITRHVINIHVKNYYEGGVYMHSI